jgi:4-alpha-glucanotransferase
VAYFSGDDIGEREREGQLSTTEAAAERAGRALWRAALLHALGIDDAGVGSGVPALALRGCLLHLASGAADLVLIDLEDLWGEREPQNRPGTGAGAANWRRRGVRTLSEARRDSPTTGFLRTLGLVREGLPVTDPPGRVEALR